VAADALRISLLGHVRCSVDGSLVSLGAPADRPVGSVGLACAAPLSRAELVDGLWGIHLSFVRELGDPAHALTQFARSADADLIVIGKSTKMLHRLVGSLGRRLVFRHDAPVIVVVP